MGEGAERPLVPIVRGRSVVGPSRPNAEQTGAGVPVGGGPVKEQALPILRCDYDLVARSDLTVLTQLKKRVLQAESSFFSSRIGSYEA